VEPARTPVGFVDRVVAAVRPRPWYRRVADAVLLPLSVKLPLEATAVVMVGLLAMYLFERTPELRQATREVPEPGSGGAYEGEAGGAARTRPHRRGPIHRRLRKPRPAGAADRADAPHRVRSPADHGLPAPVRPSAAWLRRRRHQPSAPTAVSPPPPMAEPPPEVKAQVKKEAENAAAAARSEAEGRQRVLAPRAGGDSARAAPSASRLAAKRALPSADVVARVAVKDRDAAERELTALIARMDGSVTQRRREDEATVVEAVIPQPRYAEFSDGVARIGAWQVEAERRELPAQVHVILRLQ
jgi:hypothetical protein